MDDNTITKSKSTRTKKKVDDTMIENRYGGKTHKNDPTTKARQTNKFNEYAFKIMELSKQEPDNFFSGSIQEFAEKLHDANNKYLDYRKQGMVDHIKSIDEELELLSIDQKVISLDDTTALNDISNKIESKMVERKRLDDSLKRLDDSYSNPLLQIGQSDAFTSFDSYNIDGLMYNYQLSTAMYASSWVFARAIDRPATDMLRNLWKIIPTFAPDDEKITIEQVADAIVIKNKKFDFADFYTILSSTKQKLIQANKWSRLYGGAVACLLTKEENVFEYEKPLTDMAQIEGKKFKLLVVDRYQQVFPSVEMVTDIDSIDYNTPLFYNVRTDSGSFRFHHTRVLRFANGEAPELIKRMLMGWGIPEIVRLFNEFNRDERIKNMITSALGKQSLEIIRMSGMKQYMNGQLTIEQEQELDEKLATMNRYRNFNSLIFLDKDDDYQRLDGSSVGSLSALMETNSRFVAGAIPMPQVLLYGDQQTGLSGNSFDDLLLYEDTLMSLREERLLEVAEKLSRWICWTMGENPEKIQIIFNSSLPMTATQKTEYSKGMLEMWKDLVSEGYYTKSMVVEEMLANKDKLIFGEALNEKTLARMEKTETAEIANQHNEAINGEEENQEMSEETNDIPF